MLLKLCIQCLCIAITVSALLPKIKLQRGHSRAAMPQNDNAIMLISLCLSFQMDLTIPGLKP